MYHGKAIGLLGFIELLEFFGFVGLYVLNKRGGNQELQNDFGQNNQRQNVDLGRRN
jgi:hypothetical protein